MFYSYAYPAPDGFANQAIEPVEARFDKQLGGSATLCCREGQRGSRGDVDVVPANDLRSGSEDREMGPVDSGMRTGKTRCSPLHGSN